MGPSHLHDLAERVNDVTNRAEQDPSMRSDFPVAPVPRNTSAKRRATARMHALMGRHWPPAVAVFVVLVMWEIIGRSTNPLLFAPPSRVVVAFVDMLTSGRLVTALLTTLSYLVPGFLISAIVGIGVGVLVGRSTTWGRLLDPYIQAIYATPRVVIIPLVILWFGVGYSGRIFIVWLGTVIPIIINTAIGVQYTRPELIEAARSFLATERDLVRHVILPGAVPFVLSGLRVGAERALVGAVIAEVFLSLTGIGGIIQTEAEHFNTSLVLAAATVYAAMGWVSISALGALEKRVSAWNVE